MKGDTLIFDTRLTEYLWLSKPQNGTLNDLFESWRVTVTSCKRVRYPFTKTTTPFLGNYPTQKSNKISNVNKATVQLLLIWRRIHIHCSKRGSPVRVTITGMRSKIIRHYRKINLKWRLTYIIAAHICLSS